MAQSITTQAQAITTQGQTMTSTINRDVVPYENKHVSSMAKDESPHFILVKRRGRPPKVHLLSLKNPLCYGVE